MDLAGGNELNAPQRAAIRQVANQSAAISTIEDPATINRLINLGFAVGTATTAGFAALFYVFDERAAAWSTLGLTLTAVVCWLTLYVAKFSRGTVAAAVVILSMSVANHFVVHVTLGGFANSGGYLFGGLVTTLVASLALPRVATSFMALTYCGGAIVLALNETALAASRSAPAAPLSTILFVTVYTGSFIMLVPVFGYFLGQLATERARSEALLLNILPEAIVARLKSRPGMIADRHEHCSVVFADLVGFTAHAKGKDPAGVVAELNTIFSRFDVLAREYRAEKIKTIGDGYMAACGLPNPDTDHVSHACELALAMLEAMPALNAELGTRFQLRVGINTGSAIAGIVGSTKFSYDLWGDMVNLASRLESNGVPGVVVTSAAVANALHRRYTFEPLGTRNLKGEGDTDLFALVSPAARRSG